MHAKIVPQASITVLPLARNAYRVPQVIIKTKRHRQDANFAQKENLNFGLAVKRVNSVRREKLTFTM